MYLEGGRHGCKPQPGMALLRLAECKPDAAAAAPRGILGLLHGQDAPRARLSRPMLFGPCAEILHAARHRPCGRRRADADRGGGRGATGSCLAAASVGDVAATRCTLRSCAMPSARRLRLPASRRSRVQRKCAFTPRVWRSRGWESARTWSNWTGWHLLGVPPTRPFFTDCEREVLALVAAGNTNRSVAACLGISAHIVARHVSNIFDKRGVSSRTAAGSFVHRHRLV